MPKVYMLKAKINGYEIPMVPSNAKLTPVNGYYKRRKGLLYYCEIREAPENAWRNVVEYAEYMKERYGKEIKLSIALTRDGRYLRYEREAGVPLYIAEDGFIYTTCTALKKPAKLNVTVRFLVESCGYKVKEKRICNWI